MKQVKESAQVMLKIFQYRDAFTPLEPRRAILHGQWVDDVHLVD